jgi:hypothetical protein
VEIENRCFWKCQGGFRRVNLSGPPTAYLECEIQTALPGCHQFKRFVVQEKIRYESFATPLQHSGYLLQIVRQIRQEHMSEDGGQEDKVEFPIAEVESEFARPYPRCGIVHVAKNLGIVKFKIGESGGYILRDASVSLSIARLGMPPAAPTSRSCLHRHDGSGVGKIRFEYCMDILPVWTARAS